MNGLILGTAGLRLRCRIGDLRRCGSMCESLLDEDSETLSGLANGEETQDPKVKVMQFGVPFYTQFGPLLSGILNNLKLDPLLAVKSLSSKAQLFVADE